MPGTDGALLLALIHEIVATGTTIMTSWSLH
jgi:anaerobic selenocysteine-containing dehydrogenase